ncbi:uncharacterized protein [Physcomitrium patens]|uniref:uncharacterized protein isoform X2 n=1 Tax=Physcomitrium patens TaxID=3218 RepID=UPI003CCCEC36
MRSSRGAAAESRSWLCQSPPGCCCCLGPGKAAPAAAEARRRVLPNGRDKTPGAVGGAVAGEGNNRRFVVSSPGFEKESERQRKQRRRRRRRRKKKNKKKLSLNLKRQRQGSVDKV